MRRLLPRGTFGRPLPGTRAHRSRGRAGMASAGGQAGLLADLQAWGYLRSPEVLAAFRAVDRALFAPRAELAYSDEPLSLGHGATISAPHMHAVCAELLREQLRPGARVLDVGSGSGYLSALFAELVGPRGEVTGVEHVPELVAQSRAALARVPLAKRMLGEGALQVHQGDGFEGWAARAPYDAIHVGAAAEALPDKLVQQLAGGGRMIIPVGEPGRQVLQVVDRGRGGGEVTMQPAMGVAYVPLTSLAQQLGGAAGTQQPRRQGP